MKILERHGMHENILIRAHTNFHLLEKTLEHIQIARHSQTDLEKLHWSSIDFSTMGAGNLVSCGMCMHTYIYGYECSPELIQEYTYLYVCPHIPPS